MFFTYIQRGAGIYIGGNTGGGRHAVKGVELGFDIQIADDSSDPRVALR